MRWLSLPLAAVLLQAPTASPAAAQTRGADSAAAQTRGADSAAVVAVVQRFIDALMARDTAYLRAAMLPGASVVAIEVPAAPEAVPAVQTTDAFLAAQARSTRRFVGRVWAPRVSVEGPIAVFVAPYDAWLDGTFGACGIDHYVLARVGERWLVSQLIFTRQRAHCAPSPLGPPR